MKKIIKYILAKMLGKRAALRIAHTLIINTGQNVDKFLAYGVSAKLFNERDLLLRAYNLAGIDDYGDAEHTGELFLLKSILPKVFKTDEPVIFDVGANVGDYCQLLKRSFPKAKIFAFEPNPAPFSKLNTLDLNKLYKFNVGLGSSRSTSEMYDYGNNEVSSEHGSLFKEVFTDIHKNQELKTINIRIDILDEVCEEQGITQIDFLKIDTEGYEFEVLSGARRMINENRIKVIQLEFNEMNVVSRVFLRDFYHLLNPGFNFFRLRKDVLLPLGEYDSINEIFRYQNLILINKELGTVL